MDITAIQKNQFGTIPNQYRKVLKYFSETEKDIFIYFQLTAPNENFSISILAKNLGIKWETANKAFQSLINKGFINSFINDGITIYKIDFTTIMNGKFLESKDISIESPDYNITSTAPIEFIPPTVTEKNITKCKTVIEAHVEAPKQILIAEPVQVVKQAVKAPVEAPKPIVIEEPAPAVKSNFSKFFDSSDEPITQKELEKYKQPEVRKLEPVKAVEELVIIKEPSIDLVALQKHTNSHNQPLVYKSKFISKDNLIYFSILNNLYCYFLSLNKSNYDITKAEFELYYFATAIYTSNNENISKLDNRDLLYEIFDCNNQDKNICSVINSDIDIFKPRLAAYNNYTLKYQIAC